MGSVHSFASGGAEDADEELFGWTSHGAEQLVAGLSSLHRRGNSYGKSRSVLLVDILVGVELLRLKVNIFAIGFCF